jgi:signal transduction histidine kinase
MTQELPENANRLVRMAHNNSERLILLINDMLDVDKIASGQMRFDVKAEALSPLVQRAVETNQPYAEKLGVSIAAATIDGELQVQVDADRLLQVLSNLLSNAAKFSSHGEQVDIDVVTSGNLFRILVKDRGQGISEEFRARIFGKFSQAYSSGSRARAAPASDSISAMRSLNTWAVKSVFIRKSTKAARSGLNFRSFALSRHLKTSKF